MSNNSERRTIEVRELFDYETLLMVFTMSIYLHKDFPPILQINSKIEPIKAIYMEEGKLYFWVSNSEYDYSSDAESGYFFKEDNKYYRTTGEESSRGFFELSALYNDNNNRLKLSDMFLMISL